jgi:hypothetical protein
MEKSSAESVLLLRRYNECLGLSDRKQTAHNHNGFTAGEEEDEGDEREATVKKV